MSVSNKELFAKNFAALSGAGITLKDFVTMSEVDAQDLVASLATVEAMDFEAEDSSEHEANVYLNIEIMINGRLARITGVRLDSDFVQFMDKEHTKINKVASSLLKTIENKGVEYSNEKAQFKVTIQKQGESNIVVTDELF